MADAAHHADDLEEAVGAVADVDPLANRIAVGKVALDELLIDDRDLGDLSPSRSVNARPRRSGMLERLEVVRAGDAIVGRWLFVRLWRRLALDREGKHVVAAHRQRLRHAGRGDLGQRLEALEQPVEEGHAVVSPRDRRLPGSATRNARTCSGWKPGSTLVSRAKLRRRSAAPTSSTIDMRDFGDEQAAPHPLPARRRRRSAAFLEHRANRAARRLPGRREAEEDARHDRNREREEQHRAVDRDVG